MLRGGSWNNTSNNARAAYRNNNNPTNRNNNNGFRVARPYTALGQDVHRLRMMRVYLECKSAGNSCPPSPIGAKTNEYKKALPVLVAYVVTIRAVAFGWQACPVTIG